MSLKAGRVKEEGDLLTTRGSTIAELYNLQAYKYLGVHQTITQMKGRTRRVVEEEYLKRVTEAWSAGLNTKNAVHLHNSWAVAKLRYFFQTGIYGKSHARDLVRKTRATLCRLKAHESMAAVERLYISQKQGGRKLTNLVHLWEWAVLDLWKHLQQTEDERLKGVLAFHQGNGGETILLKEHANEIMQKHGIEPKDLMAKSGLKLLKAKQQESLQSSLREKRVHGAHQKLLEDEATDKADTNRWLTTGVLDPETEGLAIGMQDGAIRTAAYRSRVLKENISPNCRACHSSAETVAHILSMCQRSLFGLIAERHDEVVRCVARGLIHSGRTHVPRNIKKGMAYRLSDSATVIIDRPIPTIDDVRENRPDIVVIETARILIIEIAVASETIVINRERAKFCKYQD